MSALQFNPAPRDRKPGGNRARRAAQRLEVGGLGFAETGPQGTGGFVLVIVLLMIAILASAGVYGIRSMESELRASAYSKRSELLAHAAEAGAAARLAEIEVATADAGAAMQEKSRLEKVDATTKAAQWEKWPSAAPFQHLATVSPDDPSLSDVVESTEYQVQSQLLATVFTHPPPGVAVGSGGELTLWEITSYAVYAGDSNMTGEHAVSVGVSLWSRGGTTYEAD